PEMRAQALAQGEVRLQELDCADDQIPEVDHATTLHSFLVCLVGGGKNAQAVPGAGLGGEQKRRGVYEVLLHQRDERQQVVGDALADGLLVEVDQGVRLPGARSGKDAERAVDVVDVQWQVSPLVRGGRSDYAGGPVPRSAPRVKGVPRKRPSSRPSPPGGERGMSARGRGRLRFKGPFDLLQLVRREL